MTVYVWNHKKKEKDHVEAAIRVVDLLDAGWSINAAYARAGITYEYGTFLREKYPEFNEFVQSKSKFPKRRRKND